MSKHVLVIGDTILDHNVYCEPIGLSLETPTIKTRFSSEDYSFGGAANVVSNLLALGCKVSFITGIARDKYASIIDAWAHPNLSLCWLPYNGQNTVKSRFWLSRNDVPYKYLQMNQGTPMDTAPSQILNAVKNGLGMASPDLVLLVDYRHGMFRNEEFTQEVIALCHSKSTPVISSSQTSSRGDRYSFFCNSDLICMNQFEAESHMHNFLPTALGMRGLSTLLRANVCVTLGSKGCTLFKNQVCYSHEGYRISTVDTCGAGDAFLAALALKYEEEDLEFCNKWAAISTTRNGVYVPTLGELNDFN